MSEIASFVRVGSAIVVLVASRWAIERTPTEPGVTIPYPTRL